MYEFIFYFCSCILFSDPSGASGILLSVAWVVCCKYHGCTSGCYHNFINFCFYISSIALPFYPIFFFFFIWSTLFQICKSVIVCVFGAFQFIQNGFTSTGRNKNKNKRIWQTQQFKLYCTQSCKHNSIFQFHAISGNIVEYCDTRYRFSSYSRAVLCVHCMEYMSMIKSH